MFLFSTPIDLQTKTAPAFTIPCVDSVKRSSGCQKTKSCAQELRVYSRYIFPASRSIDNIKISSPRSDVPRQAPVSVYSSLYLHNFDMDCQHLSLPRPMCIYTPPMVQKLQEKKAMYTPFPSYRARGLQAPHHGHHGKTARPYST